MTHKNISCWQIWTFCSFLCFLTSCYPVGGIADPYIVPDSRQKENFYYVPTSANVPLLTEKNDLSLSVQRSSDNKHSGGEIQAAYIPGKHIGLITNYSTGNNQKNHSLLYKRFEIGGGYITTIDSQWHLETYAGYGAATINNNNYTGDSQIRTGHFFIQPAISVSNIKKTIQCALFSKFAGTHFKVTEAYFTADREPFTTSQVKLLGDEPFHVFWEPGIIFRFGWENVLLHTGFSYSTDLTNSELYRAKTNFSIGFTLRLNTANY